MEKLLEMKEICKSFGTNNVLKNVQFDLFAGEVHALIGENGAGKSTLMKILMGMYKKDSGSLSVLGSDEAYTNPDQALKAGVAMIHQELNPIPDMSVAENIFLGKEKRKWIFTSKKEQEKESKRYLDMLGIDLEPSVLMRELSVSEMQMVEIAKALSYGARIIIMDEPTSAITEAEVEKLFQNIKMLKEQGTGIIYISHKMDELFEISDRITVLRDGQYVFSKKTKDLCPNDLIKAMVGREITEIYPESKSKIGEVILKVKHASRKGEFKKIDFELRKGEKLGIAGLMGAGRTELMMAVFGAAKLEEGEIEIGGVPVRIQSPKDAIRQKIALVTEDRKRYGLNLTASVEDNAVSVIESSLSKFGFYRRKLGRKAAEEMISRMNTKVTGMDQIVGSLSGGNMQKVVLSKWLLNDPDIIIFDEPTRGIDVGAKAEIYKIIEELACKGKGIIIISSEMPELIGLSQRIIGQDTTNQICGGYDAVLEKYPNVEVVFEGAGNWGATDAAPLAENWLASGKEIDAIVCNNDGMALGVVPVLKSAGKSEQIKVYGLDATNEGLKAVDSGEMAATIYVDSKAEIEKAFEMLEDLKAGKKVDAEYKVPSVLVTKENVKEYMK